MSEQRPDLSGVSDEIRTYIEALETKIEDLTAEPETAVAADTPPEPTEPITTRNIVTISAQGVVKRTPRHFYSRQRRGGMGVFDLETDDDDRPNLLAVADEESSILLFSNFGRAFRPEMSQITETPVRAGGQHLSNLLPLRPHEQIVAALPYRQDGVYVALVTQRGWVRRVQSSSLGRALIPGMTFHNVQQGGRVTAACWTPGNAHLFMGTRQGKGIRFRETQVPRDGCLGLRVDVGDEVNAVTAVTDSDGVFLLSQDGKGTIRQMSGFRANKAPGAGGKIALKTDHMVAAFTVNETDDIFIISATGKIIRFQAEEIPAKTGAVQGVNCISLRNDEVVAATVGDF